MECLQFEFLPPPRSLKGKVAKNSIGSAKIFVVFASHYLELKFVRKHFSFKQNRQNSDHRAPPCKPLPTTNNIHVFMLQTKSLR